VSSAFQSRGIATMVIEPPVRERVYRMTPGEDDFGAALKAGLTRP